MFFKFYKFYGLDSYAAVAHLIFVSLPIRQYCFALFPVHILSSSYLPSPIGMFFQTKASDVLFFYSQCRGTLTHRHRHEHEHTSPSMHKTYFIPFSVISFRLRKLPSLQREMCLSLRLAQFTRCHRIAHRPQAFRWHETYGAPLFAIHECKSIKLA